MIRGYKCFNKGLINQYGMQFEVGKIYQAKGEIVFGSNGNGYHMCANLEDTLRFFDTWQKDVDICEVLGSGKSIPKSDDYNEYYEMYAVEYMYICRQLSREEIIKYGLELSEFRLLRFISLYKLTPEEKELFINKYQNFEQLKAYIEYYQDDKKDAFTKRLLQIKKSKEKNE